MNEEEKHTKLDYLIMAVGFIPYIGLTFLTVWLWDKYMGLPEMSTLTWRNFVYAPSYLMAFSILGSWVAWWLFCKIISFLWYNI